MFKWHSERMNPTSFSNLDSDGDVDGDDKALHPSLTPEYGWVLPVATNTFRRAQLQTDVGLSGIHTLTLFGDACRVWQTASPCTNDAPLLVGGQTVTNGVNGVSWNTTSTANVYIQAISNGNATLTYSFMGTGPASGIVSRASMKMTIVTVEIMRDGRIITDTTTDVNVGEKISLEGLIRPLGIPITQRAWTIPGHDDFPFPRVVEGYSVSVSNGKVIPLAINKVFEPAVSFYWVDGGTGLEVEYVASFGGTSFRGKAKFNVKRPTSSFTSMLTDANPAVDVRDNETFTGEILVFGELVVSRPAITWTPEVATEDNASGKLAIFQLINLNVQADGNGSFSLSSMGYVLDSSLRDVFGVQIFVVPYADAETLISSNETIIHKHVTGEKLSDTPFTDFDAYEVDILNHVSITNAALTSLSRSDQFETYLMYKSDTADSIWVPLKKMTWHWSGSATKGDDTWSLVEGSGDYSSTPPAGNDTIEMPEWDNHLQALSPEQAMP